MSQPNVLFVDDEPRLRDVITRSINSLGFPCKNVSSAEDALKHIAENPTDIVITDLMMPGMDGMTLCRKIRESKYSIQIIILTGHGDLDAAQEAIRLDAVDFLTKPCGMGTLEQSLDRAWKRLRHPDEIRVRIDPRALADEDENITDEPFEQNIPLPDSTDTNTTYSLEEVERNHILRTLHQHRGNRRDTANALGVSLRTLYYRLRQYESQGHL